MIQCNYNNILIFFRMIYSGTDFLFRGRFLIFLLISHDSLLESLQISFFGISYFSFWIHFKFDFFDSLYSLFLNPLIYHLIVSSNFPKLKHMFIDHHCDPNSSWMRPRVTIVLDFISHMSVFYTLFDIKTCIPMVSHFTHAFNDSLHPVSASCIGPH